MIIYLDESGDLGFNFSSAGASHYLIMTCLICNTLQSTKSVKRAIKLTLKNKLAAKISEAKGSDVSLMVKKYFFKYAEQEQGWEIMAVAADKQAWLRNHDNHASKVDKNLFYDEVAKRLLSQIQLKTDARHIQLIVDKSKSPSALKDFDERISSALYSFISEKTLLSIYHRHSFDELGLQAVDLFGWGIFRKYQWADCEWYDAFKHRIALEMEFKF